MFEVHCTFTNNGFLDDVDMSKAYWDFRKTNPEIQLYKWTTKSMEMINGELVEVTKMTFTDNPRNPNE